MSENPRATIVCCYNNERQYNVFTQSLEEQDEKVALIGIDNTNKRFTSNAAAFNYAMKSVTTKYVIFSHQDIILTTSKIIRQFVDYLERIGENDILGVAGAKNDDPFVLTNVRRTADGPFAGSERVKGLISCDTLDECFFGGYSKCFKQYQFDETICNGWHLYAVDRCLDAKRRNNKVYVCDISLIHTSKGNIDQAYNRCFLRLSKKYCKDIQYIKTPCAYARTGLILRNISFVKRWISIKLNRY